VILQPYRIDALHKLPLRDLVDVPRSSYVADFADATVHYGYVNPSVDFVKFDRKPPTIHLHFSNI